jgi:hypothetical protein
MTFILLLSLPAFFASIYLTAKYHSDLIELEYSKYRESWETEGRPQGWGRSRQETGMQVLGWGRIYTGFNWLIYEPAWIKGDKDAQELRKHMRLSFAVSSLAGTINLVLLVCS